MLPRPLCCRYNKAKEADIVMMRAEKEETGRYVLFPRVKAECPEARVSQGAPAIGAALRGAMQGHKVLCVECYPGVDQEEVLACLQPVGAQLVVHSDASSVPGDTSVTGSETWKFTFTVGVRPSVRLSGTTVNQGSAVAVRVGETLDGQPPQIKTELQNTGFFAASSGWVCYLPIPWNQSAGTQTIEVTAGGYTETLELKIRATEWEYKDYYSNSQRVSPYIGENDIPAELQKLLQTSETTIGWSDGSFVQPFLNTLDVKLAFGTTEYVGRSYSERQSNNGAGGRTVTNLVLNTKAGELLIAPASGKVLLAKDLGGDFGYTLVIDHGAGVKSIFYNLQALNVKAGASVKQGQTLATCNSTTVAEMRIGTVPIDPLQVWRGQCDALKNY